MFRYPDLSAKIGRLMDDYVLALRSKDETPGLLLAMTREAEAAILDKYQADVTSKQQGMYSKLKRQENVHKRAYITSFYTLQKKSIKNSSNERARNNVRQNVANYAQNKSNTRRTTRQSIPRIFLSSQSNPPQSPLCIMRE